MLLKWFIYVLFQKIIKPYSLQTQGKVIDWLSSKADILPWKVLAIDESNVFRLVRKGSESAITERKQWKALEFFVSSIA